MLLKDLLKIIVGDDKALFYSAKIDLWDADNAHKDIIVNTLVDDIPKELFNSKVELENGLIAKERNHFIISIHTK